MRWTGFGLFAFLWFCCVSLVISKNYIYIGARANILVVVISSLLAEVSPDEAKRRGRRKTPPFLSFLPHREKPLLAGKVMRWSWSLFLATVCHVENVNNAFSEFPCFVKRLMDTEEKFKLFPKKLIVLHRVPVDRNEEKAPAVSQRKAKIHLSL